MRLSVITFILLAAAFIPMKAQQPPESNPAVTRILALENAWNKAEKHKDTGALDSLLASTLVYIDYDGTYMNKAQFMASVKAPQLHPEQIVNEIMNANVYGDGAVVTGTYHEKGVDKGKPYLRRGRFTDTWVNQGGTWVCVASQSTLISK